MKTNRAEQIAALVVDPHSGFKTNDENMLESCSDERLAEFRAASDARRVDEQKARTTETELTKANARLKVTEEKLRAAEQAPSEEEWMAKAPAKFKALYDADKAQEDAIRAAVVSKLKDLGANTEADRPASRTGGVCSGVDPRLQWTWTCEGAFRFQQDCELRAAGSVCCGSREAA